jgi:hypothetical protein
MHALEYGMARKLSKFERLVDEQMLALLEWAADHPKHWHNLGPEEATKRAAEALEKRGVIETRQPMNQYRLKPRSLSRQT